MIEISISHVRSRCSKRPPKHCCCMSQVLLSCIFLFLAKIFLITLESSSWIRVLFRGMLFNLNVFSDFPALFLSLILSLRGLWSDSRHCRISVH